MPARARSSTWPVADERDARRRTRRSPRASSTSASCWQSSARRSGCTCRAIRWPTSATSSGARSTARSALPAAPRRRDRDGRRPDRRDPPATSRSSGEPMAFVQLEDQSAGRGDRLQHGLRPGPRPPDREDRIVVLVKGRVDRQRRARRSSWRSRCLPFDAVPRSAIVRVCRSTRAPSPATAHRRPAGAGRDFPGDHPVVVELLTSRGPKAPTARGEFRVRRSRSSSPRCGRSSATRRWSELPASAGSRAVARGLQPECHSQLLSVSVIKGLMLMPS